MRTRSPSDSAYTSSAGGMAGGHPRPSEGERPSSSTTGCTLAVRGRAPERTRPRNARKRQQNAEGVGFEPTEALRLQRFSRWRGPFANPSNFECSGTFTAFVVPAHPASSRLIPARWLYTWLYRPASCTSATGNRRSAMVRIVRDLSVTRTPRRAHAQHTTAGCRRSRRGCPRGVAATRSPEWEQGRRRYVRCLPSHCGTNTLSCFPTSSH